jgi:hypothetical protein
LDVNADFAPFEAAKRGRQVEWVVRDERVGDTQID